MDKSSSCPNALVLDSNKKKDLTWKQIANTTFTSKYPHYLKMSCKKSWWNKINTSNTIMGMNWKPEDKGKVIKDLLRVCKGTPQWQNEAGV